MKKIIFALVVLMLAAPAWADVVITCSNSVVDGNNVVTVSYNADSEANLVRAIALEITLSGSGEFSDVNCLSKNFGYHIYLGDIDIDSEGTVQSWGSCQCDGAYPDTPDDANHMTIEAASLYEVGVDPDPDKSGDLVSFMLTGNDEVCVSIAENAIRGKVVMENADEVVDVNTEDTVCVQLPASDCMKATHPDYAEWVGQSKPDCWCYAKQCMGDIDGALLGPLPVSINDLNLFRVEFNQLEPLTLDVGICSDLDHQTLGPLRVSINDLNIIRVNFNQLEINVPDCDNTHINFWTTP